MGHIIQLAVYHLLLTPRFSELSFVSILGEIPVYSIVYVVVLQQNGDLNYCFSDVSLYELLASWAI